MRENERRCCSGALPLPFFSHLRLKSEVPEGRDMTLDTSTVNSTLLLLHVSLLLLFRDQTPLSLSGGRRLFFFPYPACPRHKKRALLFPPLKPQPCNFSTILFFPEWKEVLDPSPDTSIAAKNNPTTEEEEKEENKRGGRCMLREIGRPYSCM